MKTLIGFLLLFSSFTLNSNEQYIPKKGEVRLHIKGEGFHKLDIVNEQLYDFITVYIKVDCEEDKPIQL